MESKNRVSFMCVCLYICNVYIIFYIISSPYLLVFCDDRVMCCTRANDVAGGSNEA